MKYLVVIFIFCVNGIYAQVYPNYLQTNPSQDADTANVAIYYGTGNGNLTGRAEDSITLILSEIGGVQRFREKCRSIN